MSSIITLNLEHFQYFTSVLIGISYHLHIGQVLAPLNHGFKVSLPGSLQGCSRVRSIEKIWKSTFYDFNQLTKIRNFHEKFGAFLKKKARFKSL